MNVFLKIYFTICCMGSFSYAFVPDIYSYHLNEKDFKELEAIESILAILNQQKDLVYPDTSSLLQAIQTDMKDFPDAYSFVASFIRDKAELQSEYAYKDCTENDDGSCPVKKIWLSAENLEVLKGGLRNSGRFVVIAPPAIQIMKSMENVEYVDSLLLFQSLQYRLMLAMNICPGNLTSKDLNLQSLRLSDDDYSALKASWIRTKEDQRAFMIIDSIRFAKRNCSLKEWDTAYNAVGHLFHEYLKTPVALRIKKFYPYDSLQAIQWSGKDCGCTQEDAINGSIYGFFSLGKAVRDTQKMDFGVLNRIGVYGLTFDANGMIINANQPDPSSALKIRKQTIDFVRQAHQYRTKIDWVIEKNSWSRNWIEKTEDGKKEVFRNLVGQIVELLSAPVEGALVRFTKKVSYSPNEPLTRGDGVNLFFRNYPTDSVSTRLFEEFFKELKDSLRAKDCDYYVNIMATRLDMSKNAGIYSYRNFRKLLRNDSSALDENGATDKDLKEKIRTYLLLFLEEPTSQSKQALRFEIDRVLQGADHKIFMRSLIPVLSFDYKSWAQLSEDISYFNDAYYGIGLWPIQETNTQVSNQSCVEGANLPNCLRQDFFQDGTENDLPSFLEIFTCEHRWGIRLALFLTMLFFILVIPFAIFVCKIRHKIAKNPLLYLAAFVFPPCLLFTILLFYDPVLLKLRLGNWPFLIALIFVLAGGGIVIAVLKYKKEKPVRMGL